MTDTTLIELSRSAPRINPLGAIARQFVLARLATLRAGVGTRWSWRCRVTCAGRRVWCATVLSRGSGGSGSIMPTFSFLAGTTSVRRKRFSTSRSICGNGDVCDI